MMNMSKIQLYRKKEKQETNLSNCEKSGGARRTTMVQGRVVRILSMAARFLATEYREHFLKQI